MQTPREQNTIQLHRIKTVNTRKTKGGNANEESHSVAGGEGAGAPAPTAAGLSVSILYRAWPWAWGKGCPSPRHVSEYPEVEGRKARSTGANRLNRPSTHVGIEPTGHGSGCSLTPGELVLPPGTAHSPEGVGLFQRLVPPSSQASSTRQRRRQTQALQRANTEYLHLSPKHGSERVVPCPRLLTLSRPLKVSHS